MKTSTKSTVPPKSSTIQLAKKAASTVGVQPTKSFQRPSSAKPQYSIVTLDKSKQLSHVQSSKESDMGIHMTQILNYYRSRVEAFEKDRM